MATERSAAYYCIALAAYSVMSLLLDVTYVHCNADWPLGEEKGRCFFFFFCSQCLYNLMTANRETLNVRRSALDETCPTNPAVVVFRVKSDDKESNQSSMEL